MTSLCLPLSWPGGLIYPVTISFASFAASSERHRINISFANGLNRPNIFWPTALCRSRTSASPLGLRVSAHSVPSSTRASAGLRRFTGPGSGSSGATPTNSSPAVSAPCTTSRPVRMTNLAKVGVYQTLDKFYKESNFREVIPEQLCYTATVTPHGMPAAVT